MSYTGKDTQNNTAANGNQSDADNSPVVQLRETRTRLNKHILKLVFSHLGRSDDLDCVIREFKSKLQKAGSETERDDLINSIIEDILKFSDEVELSQADAGSDEKDLFVELLNRLSISHAHADEFVDLSNRIREIQEYQEKLEIVKETISLLTNSTEVSVSDHRELLLNLIDYIRLPGRDADMLDGIKQKIYRNKNQGDDIGLLRQLSEIINQSNEKLQNEFRDIRQYISEVIGKLGELNEYLVSSRNDQQAALTESRKLKASFLENNRTLQMKIDSSSDVEEIKDCVNAHIAAVNDNLKNHIDSETRIHDNTDRRLKSMQKSLKGMQRQCDDLKKKLHKARQDAMHDALTGLPNRLAFDEQFIKERSRYERYQHPLTMAVLDIDHFKHVNDTYGHKAGDKVLKAVAEVCSDHIRKSDYLARYGGEEFVLLLPNTGLEAAYQAMDNLRATIDDCHFHYSDQSVPITVSIGLAEFMDDESAETIFKRADEALYAAKDGGRNRCMTSSQLDSAA